jgi:glycosyltransferase involved in cell wall biosynthesis
MPSLHIAILDEELPFPLTSGKRIRTYHLLSRLASRHRLTYLCHRNPDSVEAARAEEAMRDLGIRTIIVERRVPAKKGLRFYARLAVNLFSALPYSVATHHSRPLCRGADQLMHDDPPDLWHCEWTPYAQTLRPLLLAHNPMTTPWVVMAHNVESLIWQRYAETETNWLKHWYIRRQQRKFERFEAWAYSACNCAIAVSVEDAQLIGERFGARSVAVVDNGVDTNYFEPQSPCERDPFRILFLGSFDWRPNLDAVRVLLAEILPRVRAAEPRATLALVGRKPPAWLRDLAANQPGVELHADVADVRPFLAGAGMLAVPLRIGGGSRLKILEALAAGLPVITTRVGAEGLHLMPDAHITVADEASTMANGLLRLMNNPKAVQEQAERGRQRVLERYDWAGLADRLDDVWLANVGNARPLQISPAACPV